MIKKMFLKNSLEIGKVYYGLHMSEGLAHYTPPGEQAFTVFIENQTIKLMNSTFSGKPVYVGHVDEHTPLSESDGVVADSFYNPADGKHWCKFIVTTQKGLDAINKGWKLSNSLKVNKHSAGGNWHGLDYDRTVNKGTFHHLAIVDTPRYAESVIFTPEQFKSYNKEKQAELEMLSNSKEKPSMFNFLKNEAQDDKKNKELLSMSVQLPKTKRTLTVEQLCNEADAEKEAPTESEVDIDGAKMTLSAFVEMYKKLKAQFDGLQGSVDEEAQLSNSEDESEESSEESEEEDDDLDESGDMEEESEDEGDMDEEALDAADAADAVQEKLDNAKTTKKKVVATVVTKTVPAKGSVAKKLSNAADKATAKLNNSNVHVVDLTSDQIRRGAERYGSNKKK